MEKAFWSRGGAGARRKKSSSRCRYVEKNIISALNVIFSVLHIFLIADDDVDDVSSFLPVHLANNNEWQKLQPKGDENNRRKGEKTK